MRYAHLNVAAGAAPAAPAAPAVPAAPAAPAKEYPKEKTRRTQKNRKKVEADKIKNIQTYEEAFDFFLHQPIRRLQYCRTCPSCIMPDCNQCKYCLDKPKNGGEWFT